MPPRSDSLSRKTISWEAKDHILKVKKLPKKVFTSLKLSPSPTISEEFDPSVNIIDFYRGVSSNQEDETIDDILKYDDRNIRDNNIFMHYLFPLKKKDKPVSIEDRAYLTDDDILEFSTDPIIKKTVIKAIKMAMRYFGYQIINGELIRIPKIDIKRSTQRNTTDRSIKLFKRIVDFLYTICKNDDSEYDLYLLYIILMVCKEGEKNPTFRKKTRFIKAIFEQIDGEAESKLKFESKCDFKLDVTSGSLRSITREIKFDRLVSNTFENITKRLDSKCILHLNLKYKSFGFMASAFSARYQELFKKAESSSLVEKDSLVEKESKDGYVLSSSKYTFQPDTEENRYLNSLKWYVKDNESDIDLFAQL